MTNEQTEEINEILDDPEFIQSTRGLWDKIRNGPPVPDPVPQKTYRDLVRDIKRIHNNCRVVVLDEPLVPFIYCYLYSRIINDDPNTLQVIYTLEHPGLGDRPFIDILKIIYAEDSNEIKLYYPRIETFIHEIYGEGEKHDFDNCHECIHKIGERMKLIDNPDMPNKFMNRLNRVIGYELFSTLDAEYPWIPGATLPRPLSDKDSEALEEVFLTSEMKITHVGDKNLLEVLSEE